MSMIRLIPAIIKCSIVAARADWSEKNIRAAAPHLQHLLIKKQNEKKHIRIRVFI